MKKERIPFRDYTAEAALFMRRALVALIVILTLISVLIANLYYLQVERFDDYTTRADQNRIKLIPISPNRGIIYDRNGIALAENRNIYRLELIPEQVENIQQTLTALRPLINLSDDDLANFEKERKRSRRFMPIIIKNGLSELEIARFTVNQYHFPGVTINSYLQRYYPYASSLTHVIGYVSKINDKDVERLDQEGKLPNYADTHDIGKLGIEKYYEDVLHGKTGYAEVEVNNRGRVIRNLQQQPPLAGKDIYLTLDLKLQQYIETLLIGRRAAVVVTDPRTGGILAMVSSPGYDPNLFVDGISRKNYNELMTDPDRPLINRAVQGVYPPGSTVKPYILVSALAANVITPNTTIYSSGAWQLPGSEKSYRDWKKGGHGTMNGINAIAESADTFFYQVAYQMGIDRLSTWMSRFGYGQYTGIDLAEEMKGLMPTRDWKLRTYKKAWYQGDTIPVGIGQGYWLATPIQLNKVLMTLINDGNVKIPHFLLSTREAGNLVPASVKVEPPLEGIPADFWNLSKQGMFGMANSQNGTGRRYFANAPYKIAAKSGTAQVFSLKKNESYDAGKLPEHKLDHKLMTAYAPYEDPKVAVAIILENAAADISVGGVTRQILDHILLGSSQPAAPIAPGSSPTESDQ